MNCRALGESCGSLSFHQRKVWVSINPCTEKLLRCKTHRANRLASERRTQALPGFGPYLVQERAETERDCCVRLPALRRASGEWQERRRGRSRSLRLTQPFR